MEIEVLFQEEPRAYLLGDVPYKSVTDRLKAAGLGEDFSRIPRAALEHARQRGDAVHTALMYLLQGRLNWATVDPRIIGYVKAGDKFLAQSGVHLIAVEKKMVATWEVFTDDAAEPQVVGVGGRGDLFAWLHGRRGCFDWKTCTGSMSKSTGPQTAGYEFIWNKNFPDQPVEERFGVKLMPNGDYRLVEYKDPCDRAAFLCAVQGTEEDKHYWREYYGYAKVA